MTLIEKLEKAAISFENNMPTVHWIKERFTKLLSISCSALQHTENINDNDAICDAHVKLKELNEKLTKHY